MRLPFIFTENGDNRDMCTAISFGKTRHYFGRNLDLEGSFGEGVIIAPRNLSFDYRREGTRARQYAMIGMGILGGNTPLYFDAVNEYGLGMAGLNFPKNAVYLPEKAGKKNVAPFEIIPYVLGVCKTVAQARALLKEVNLVNIPFSEKLPLTPLHWMISDAHESIVVEGVAEGLMIYENPTNVLTNNPPFPMQLQRLNDYLSLTPEEPAPRFGEEIGLKSYSRGMGAIGLPGDLSSASRFVRAVFTKETCVCGEGEAEHVNAFFHILQSVAMTRGSVRLKAGVYEETVYSSCYSAEEKIYYYTTYSNGRIHGIRLEGTDLEGTMPAFYPLQKGFEAKMDN